MIADQKSRISGIPVSWERQLLPDSGPSAGSVRHSTKVPDTLKDSPNLRGWRYAKSSICVYDGEPIHQQLPTLERTASWRFFLVCSCDGIGFCVVTKPDRRRLAQANPSSLKPQPVLTENVGSASMH